MSLELGNVTFDCEDPLKVAGFWSSVFDRPVKEGGSEFFAGIPGEQGRPNMLFMKVPEAKTVKNRVHLDLDADDREAEVQRLEGLGATKLAEKDEWGVRWTVMADVEGNEFCVVQKGSH